MTFTLDRGKLCEQLNAYRKGDPEPRSLCLQEQAQTLGFGSFCFYLEGKMAELTEVIKIRASPAHKAALEAIADKRKQSALVRGWIEKAAAAVGYWPVPADALQRMEQTQ